MVNVLKKFALYMKNSSGDGLLFNIGGKSDDSKFMFNTLPDMGVLSSRDWMILTMYGDIIDNQTRHWEYEEFWQMVKDCSKYEVGESQSDDMCHVELDIYGNGVVRVNR